mgnify:CR=1 FL=1|tara:strand:- start:1128 stop:1277 length:150 start_codon:yes stop_codon:yes gene_type:complete
MVSCENINLDRVINLELKSLAFSQFNEQGKKSGKKKFFENIEGSLLFCQ